MIDELFALFLSALRFILFICFLPLILVLLVIQLLTGRESALLERILDAL